MNEWKVSEGCSWTRAFLVRSQSLYIQAKQLLPLCVWMSTHTYAHCFPTWQRFQILLLPLNTKPCFWTPTKTQPHSNAHILCSKQHSSIVSHECAPGGGGTSGALIWTFVLIWGTERVDLFGGAVASVGNKGSLNYSTCKAEVFQNYLMSFYLREINFAPLCTLLTSNMLRICDFCIIFLATAQCVHQFETV